ncbi:MAG: nicotinate-nucleotide--dimethylbenzimidazole phosphoribosyltransferase [Defluviitaleaceae bacterium]|nr:nicotinate-nucleotide--dimethylbenzimidazole phosphoribosyltransferase [Defluviitaleaceae bacterium]
MLEKTIASIKPLESKAMEQAQARLDSLIKPPGSLGELENIAAKLSGISGSLYNDISKRCVIVFASDNGVTEEGISAAPQAVTYIQTINFTKGITGVAVLAKQFGADLIVVDVGVNADIDHPAIQNKKIRKGSWNITKQPAMTREEAMQAITTGIEAVTEAVKKGYKLIGIGEMGIGNTTTSAAILSAITNTPPNQTAGKGAGLTEENYRNKVNVIKTALELNKPNPADPIDILAKVGGFDIAAMAGAYIGAAINQVPVVIDGFISIVAALCAAKLAPLAKEYMFPSHASFEQGYKIAAAALGVTPPLHLDMRLGEGSGCPLMFAIMDGACAMMRDMGTFEQGNIDDEYLEEVRDADFHIRGL